MSTPAVARDKDAPRIEVDVSVTLASDYRFRGVSLSDFDPAIQPDITVTHESGVYLNAWASNIAENGGDDIEVDLSVGWRKEMGDTALDLKATYFAYPGASADNYAELAASLEHAFGDAAVSLTAAWAPSQKNIGHRDNIYIALTGETPIKGTPLTLHGSVGYENGAFADDKLDWLVGASLDLGKGFTLDASFVDTAVRGPRLREGKAGAVVSLAKGM